MFVSRYEDKRKAILFAPAKVLKLSPAGKKKKKKTFFTIYCIHCNITKMPLEIRDVLWASTAIYLLWHSNDKSLWATNSLYAQFKA